MPHWLRTDRSDAFISGALRMLPGHHPAPLFLAHFHVQQFRPELFGQFNIVAPASISASVPKRQAEFLAGRICASTVLQRLGHSQTQVGIGRHRAPHWPDGILGSITHNAHFAAAAACADSSASGLGIDIETVIDDATGALIAHQVASPAEIARINAPVATLDAHCRLSLIFSAKESFFKAAYRQVGDYFDFDAVELMEFDPLNARLHFRCTRHLSPALQKHTRFAACYEQLDTETVLTTVVLP